MTEVRTRDEAIARLDKGLATWATSVRGVWAQATATTAGVINHIESEARRRKQKLTALQRAANRENNWLRAGIAKAEAELANAQAALATAQQAERALLAGRRRIQATIDGDVAGARANLTRKSIQLDRYRHSRMGGTPLGGTPRTGSVILGKNPLPGDLREIDVDELGCADNPIVGNFGKGRASRSDYAWATETWTTVVAPGIAQGQTRQHFAQRDAEGGAAPFRRLADVYDLFTGDSRITVSQRSDGSFDVIDGRHRIEVARQLGIRALPARVIE